MLRVETVAVGFVVIMPDEILFHGSINDELVRSLHTGLHGSIRTQMVEATDKEVPIEELHDVEDVLDVNKGVDLNRGDLHGTMVGIEGTTIIVVERDVIAIVGSMQVTYEPNRNRSIQDTTIVRTLDPKGIAKLIEPIYHLVRFPVGFVLKVVVVA